MILDGWKAIAEWFAERGVVKHKTTFQRWARLPKDPLPVNTWGRGVEARIRAWFARNYGL